MEAGARLILGLQFRHLACAAFLGRAHIALSGCAWAGAAGEYVVERGGAASPFRLSASALI